jgi:hypothetical protein
MSRHGVYRARTLPRSLGLTLLGALFPGFGFVMAGRAKLGAFVMTVAAGWPGWACTPASSAATKSLPSP